MCGARVGWIFVAFGVQQTFLLPALTLGSVMIYGFLNMLPDAVTSVIFMVGMILAISLPPHYSRAQAAGRR